MAQLFTGACSCGAIRFECSAEPLLAFNCHCRDCQRAAGASFITAIGVPSTGVKIIGQPKYYSVKGESGNSMSRGFCAECGAHLFAKWLHGQQVEKARRSRRWIEQVAVTSTDCSRYRHQLRRRDPQYLTVTPASVVRDTKSVLQFVQQFTCSDLPVYCPLL